MSLVQRSLLIVALVAFCASSASATLLFYDSFDYPTTGFLGTAGSTNWTKNGATNDPAVVGGGGLTYPGLQVNGDSQLLQYDGSGINPGNGVPAATDGHTISAGGITTGSLYYSLLLKVTATTITNGNGFAAGVNLTQGSYMAGLQTLANTAAPAVGSSAAPLCILTGDGTQNSLTYRLGTARTATNAERIYDSTQYNIGDTLLVVLKYTFDPSSSPANDSAKMFVNPTPGSPEPAPILNITGGTALTLNTGIKSFFVRNNSVEPDGMVIDELRIGDTWEDVTPAAIPEPASGALVLIGLCLSSLVRRRSD